MHRLQTCWSASRKQENPNADQSSWKQAFQAGAGRLVHWNCSNRFTISGRNSSHVSGATVTFEPGARTAWHTHPLGQDILILSQGWDGRSVTADPLKCVRAISSGSRRGRSTGTVPRRKRPCLTSRYRNLWTARRSSGLRRSAMSNIASDRDTCFTTNLAVSTTYAPCGKYL